MATEQQRLDEVLVSWPLRTQEAAKELIATFGLPNQFVDDSLKWNDPGRWKAVTLHRDEPLAA